MIYIREFNDHNKALEAQSADRADGYPVGQWFAYKGTTSYTVNMPAVAYVKRDGEK